MIKLTISACLLVLFISKSQGAMLQANAKIGEPFELDFGANNTVIKRESTGKPSQFIYADTDFWTTEDKSQKIDQGSVHFYANGTLAFDKIQKSDDAAYTRPDEPEHFVGKNAMVAKSMVILNVTE